MTVFVTHHQGETLEDAYRRSDGDEFGYQIPVELIERMEAAVKAMDEATGAIRLYIAEHDVPEVDIETGEPNTEECW
jgi:hypothetical protein